MRCDNDGIPGNVQMRRLDRKKNNLDAFSEI